MPIMIQISKWYFIKVDDEFEQADVPYGVLDQSNWILDRSVMWQAYQVYFDQSIFYVANLWGIHRDLDKSSNWMLDRSMMWQAYQVYRFWSI